jgi:C1A family cysteine protease
VKRLAWFFSLALWPSAILAQGAVIETMASLPDATSPPTFRGTPPARLDLSATLPPPRSQAATMSCVSWATTYAAASQALRRGGNAGNVVLSPAFTYNQITRDPYCHTTTTISATLQLLRDGGAVPIEEFAFDAGWCGRQPTPRERDAAQRYRIAGWSRFEAADPAAVKAQLARGVPVIFAIRSGPRLSAHRGDGVFDAPEEAPGIGHAMLAVGYDDARQAFRIQNSWGREWGDGGYAWYSYALWQRSVQVGFVID